MNIRCNRGVFLFIRTLHLPLCRALCPSQTSSPLCHQLWVGGAEWQFADRQIIYLGSNNHNKTFFIHKMLLSWVRGNAWGNNKLFIIKKSQTKHILGYMNLLAIMMFLTFVDPLTSLDHCFFPTFFWDPAEGVARALARAAAALTCSFNTLTLLLVFENKKQCLDQHLNRGRPSKHHWIMVWSLNTLNVRGNILQPTCAHQEIRNLQKERRKFIARIY